MAKVGKNFGNKLRDLRMARGLTQAEVAKKVGINYQSIHAYEKGSYSPRPKTAEKILGYLERQPVKPAPEKPTDDGPPDPVHCRCATYPVGEEKMLTNSSGSSPVRLGKVSLDWLNMTIDNHVSACGYALLDGPSKYIIMPRGGLAELCRVILKAGGISVE